MKPVGAKGKRPARPEVSNYVRQMLRSTERRTLVKRTGKELFFDILLYAVFGFYLFLLAAILFRSRLGERSVNLIPFRTIGGYLADLAGAAHLRAFALQNLLANIVIFVPLGVYAVLLNRDKRVWKNLLIVLGATVLAEVVQTVFKLGHGDIDDVLLNCAGGLLGILLCKGLYRLCGDEEKARHAVALAAPVVGAAGILLLLHGV